MSITFFNSIIGALGKKVNYEAVSNLAGNSFAKDAWKHIQQANPLTKEVKNSGFMDMIAGLAINNNSKKKKEQQAQMMKELSWAEGLDDMFKPKNNGEGDNNNG